MLSNSNTFIEKLLVNSLNRMAHYTFIPTGVCSKKISFDMTDDGILSNIGFVGGCSGNLIAIGKLCEGKKASDISAILKGTKCGNKQTSCGDQFAKALDDAMAKVAAKK